MIGRVSAMKAVPILVSALLLAPGNAAAVTLPPGSITPPTSGSFLYLNSQPGDPIGGGSEQLYTSADSTIRGTLPLGGEYFDGRVIQGFYVHQWRVSMAAPVGEPLAVGSYMGAMTGVRPAGTPGLDVFGDGRACNTGTGEFDVTAIEYSVYGELMLFDATFVQRCDGYAGALYGRIRVEIPPPTPGVTLPSGSLTVPTSGTFLYLNQPLISGGNYEQLYTTADSTFVAALPQGGDRFTASVIQQGYAHFWYVNIAAPLGQALAVGSYIRAVRLASRTADQPGLDVYGDGASCSAITGKFDVDELSFGPTGELAMFQATFEQWCDNALTALYGRIRVEVGPPLELGVTVREDGMVDNKTGAVSLSGIVSCSRPVRVELRGTISQVIGTFVTSVACDAAGTIWSAVTAGDNGTLAPGSASVSVDVTRCEVVCYSASATRSVRLDAGK